MRIYLLISSVILFCLGFALICHWLPFFEVQRPDLSRFAGVWYMFTAGVTLKMWRSYGTHELSSDWSHETVSVEVVQIYTHISNFRFLYLAILVLHTVLAFYFYGESQFFSQVRYLCGLHFILAALGIYFYYQKHKQLN